MFETLVSHGSRLASIAQLLMNICELVCGFVYECRIVGAGSRKTWVYHEGAITQRTSASLPREDEQVHPFEYTLYNILRGRHRAKRPIKTRRALTPAKIWVRMSRTSFDGLYKSQSQV